MGQENHCSLDHIHDEHCAHGQEPLPAEPCRLDHVHDEHCSHNHDHREHDHREHDHHEHDHHEYHSHEGEAFWVEHQLHDGAVVVSGGLSLTAEYEAVRALLKDELEALARTIQERGGIVGHIKVSAETKAVEMFSVTDLDVMVKHTPGQDITLTLAAIVFQVDVEDLEALVRSLLLNVWAFSESGVAI